MTAPWTVASYEIRDAAGLHAVALSHDGGATWCWIAWGPGLAADCGTGLASPEAAQDAASRWLAGATWPPADERTEAPTLADRAAAVGLERGRAWWSRPNKHHANLVAEGDDGLWRWAPESWSWGDVVRHAPRFATEEEALSAALSWLDAGCPEVPR